MSALGVDISSFEQETCGHSLPSGRSNLASQRISDRLCLARDNRDAALKDYDSATDAYERQEIEIKTLLAFRRVYGLAESWYLYILATDNYVKSVSMLIEGEIDPDTQAGIYNNMIEAGNTFGRM